MTLVPVEGDVNLSAQEILKQTKVNALEKSPDAGVECMGSEGNPQWQIVLVGCGYTAGYKASVNLLEATESKPREL